MLIADRDTEHTGMEQTEELQEYLDEFRDPERPRRTDGGLADWNRTPSEWAAPPWVGRTRLERRLRETLPAPVFELALGRVYFGGRKALRRNPGRGRVLPDFLVIGAAKAGTTSLFGWIGEHPLVAETAKEIHFFNEFFYRGADWYRSHFPLARQRAEALHEHGRPLLAGEGTATYLHHPWAARRAARVVPDAKLVLTLRNPIDRAYSHYKQAMREGVEPLATFEEALANEPERLRNEIARLKVDPRYSSWPFRNWSYLYRGHYADQLERWLEFFPRRQFLVLRAEELWSDPHASLDSVYDFLDLTAHRPPALAHLHRGQDAAPIAADTRRVLGDYFRPHNERLESLIGCELGWGE